MSPISSIKMPASRSPQFMRICVVPFPNVKGFHTYLDFTRFISVYPLRNLKTEPAIIGIN